MNDTELPRDEAAEFERLRTRLDQNAAFLSRVQVGFDLGTTLRTVECDYADAAILWQSHTQRTRESGEPSDPGVLKLVADFVDREIALLLRYEREHGLVVHRPAKQESLLLLLESLASALDDEEREKRRTDG